MPLLEEDEGFDELVFYTIPGYLSGLGVGFILDAFGISKNVIGEIFVRVLSGESESVFEGIYAVKEWVNGFNSMAMAYGWGKLLGMIFPILIHLVSLFFGINMTGIETFYIPYFYGMSDQIGANIVGFRFLYVKEGSLQKASKQYFTHPVMVSSLIVILILPLILLLLRFSGFAPTTQVKAALETIVANLCWIPPLVGSYFSN